MRRLRATSTQLPLEPLRRKSSYIPGPANGFPSKLTRLGFEYEVPVNKGASGPAGSPLRPGTGVSVPECARVTFSEWRERGVSDAIIATRRRTLRALTVSIHILCFIGIPTCNSRRKPLNSGRQNEFYNKSAFATKNRSLLQSSVAFETYGESSKTS